MTWSGRNGTPLVRANLPDLVGALARDMIEAPLPMSRHRAVETIADAGKAAISGALLSVMARDTVFCTDGLATCERIAKGARIRHFAPRRMAIEAHLTQPSHQRRARPHQPVPGLHAARHPGTLPHTADGAPPVTTRSDPTLSC